MIRGQSQEPEVSYANSQMGYADHIQLMADPGTSDYINFAGKFVRLKIVRTNTGCCHNLFLKEQKT